MKVKEFVNYWFVDFFRFIKIFFRHVLQHYLNPRFAKFEGLKDFFVGKLYQQRGKYSRLIANSVMILLMMLGVAVGPSLIVNDSQTQAMLSSGLGNAVVFAQDVTPTNGTQVLGMSTDAVQIDTLTQVSDKPRAGVMEYTVQSGDTISVIAKQFGVSTDSIKWINDGIDVNKIKPGSTLKIPPVTGVVHTVKSGETIYSIAKKYKVSAQAIVDFPFNEFTNDETFSLAIGQTLVVPDGVMPDVAVNSPNYYSRVLTPNAGVVSATGVWSWPAQGVITQRFYPWHKAIDIANPRGGPILAADSGTVIHASWDRTGYGNMVMIDHGNGWRTLYGHLSSFAVKVGQTVKRGDILGQMGSTGRSTGTHCHFEIRSPHGNVNPLDYLK